MSVKTNAILSLRRASRVPELTKAFDRADAWYGHHAGPMGGFGRGYENGEHVLKRFMPAWFQTWFKRANWHPVGLLQGEKGWWIYVKAFGLSQDAWWDEVVQIEDSTEKVTHA